MFMPNSQLIWSRIYEKYDGKWKILQGGPWGSAAAGMERLDKPGRSFLITLRGKRRGGNEVKTKVKHRWKCKLLAASPHHEVQNIELVILLGFA